VELPNNGFTIEDGTPSGAADGLSNALNSGLDEKIPDPAVEAERAAKPPPPEGPFAADPNTDDEPADPKVVPVEEGVLDGVARDAPKGEGDPKLEPKEYAPPDPKVRPLAEPEPKAVVEPEPNPVAAELEPNADVGFFACDVLVLLAPKPPPDSKPNPPVVCGAALKGDGAGAALPNDNVFDPAEPNEKPEEVVGLAAGSAWASSIGGSVASSGGAEDAIVSTGVAGSAAVVIPVALVVAKQLRSCSFSKEKVEMEPSVAANSSRKDPEATCTTEIPTG
jgi:hypothetical protein